MTAMTSNAVNYGVNINIVLTVTSAGDSALPDLFIAVDMPSEQNKVLACL